MLVRFGMLYCSLLTSSLLHMCRTFWVQFVSCWFSYCNLLQLGSTQWLLLASSYRCNRVFFLQQVIALCNRFRFDLNQIPDIPLCFLQNSILFVMLGKLLAPYKVSIGLHSNYVLLSSIAPDLTLLLHRLPHSHYPSISPLWHFYSQQHQCRMLR